MNSMNRAEAVRASWRRAWRAVLAGLAVPLALGGCASYLSAQVTAFHQPQQTFAGTRFVIEPEAAQRDSLEFRAYADLVRRGLVQQGLVAADTGTADAIVTIRYQVDEGRPVLRAYPTYGYAPYGPVWGLTPYRGPRGVIHYTWAPAYPMSYGVVGHGVSESVVYRRELRVEIQAAGPAPAAGGARLYEGTVVSEGRSASLAPVMPAMVKALFQSFPGPNGASRIVEVVLDPEPARP